MSSVSYREALTDRTAPERLTKGRSKTSSGRNNKGRITVRRRGTGHKRRLRDVDFRMEKVDIPFTVRSVEYDPNRSGFIGHIVYKDGEHRYMLLPKSVSVGDERVVSAKAPLKAGNRLLVGNVPIGTSVYNVEVKPGAGAQLIRSAGSAGGASAAGGRRPPTA